MQRFAAVWHASPLKMVGALFALLLAATMAVGSGANFNSTSANPGNVVTAGNLIHVNGKAGLPVMTVNRIRPGQSQSGTVTIANTGDIDGVFTLAKSVSVDSTAPANPFADKLRLKVEDTTAGSTLYDGALSAMGTLAAGTLAPAATHTYTFTVTFPSGTPAQDNPFKGASLTAAFDWEAVNN
jgi:spore coat-associated protein N